MIGFDIIKAELQGRNGLINKARRQFMPSGDELAELVWMRVSFAGLELSEEDVKRNFNAYLCELVDTEYALYLEHEESCVTNGIFQLLFDPKTAREFPNTWMVVQQALATLEQSDIDNRQKLMQVAIKLRPIFKVIEQSLAQGRMSRAGGSAQYHFQRLLELAGYGGEFEIQQKLNGRVDFLFPCREAWERDRRRCVIVSIKRSLRERFLEVHGDLALTGGMVVYLVVTETTREAQRDITPSKVNRLNELNIYLVVRDEIKEQRFQDAENVISFTAFINEELPARREYWRSLFKR